MFYLRPDLHSLKGVHDLSLSRPRTFKGPDFLPRPYRPLATDVSRTSGDQIETRFPFRIDVFLVVIINNFFTAIKI